MATRLSLEPGWQSVLEPILASETGARLRALLREEKARGNAVYPPRQQIFAAFENTPLADVRVVIVGQDPYHGPGQAMGLSFSVPSNVKSPPSLRNIYKEISTDLEVPTPQSGDLTAWSQQGVLLLNASLTVRAGAAGSHAGAGWEEVTDAAISAVSERCEAVVFMLWGRFAQSKRRLIDTNRHLVLAAAHPSPLSAHNGFFGCRHFSKANDWLKDHGKSPIDWA